MSEARRGSFRQDELARFQWTNPEKVSIPKQMEELYERIKKRDPNQKEFLQAFHEVLFSLQKVFEKHPKYLDIMETIAEPERMIQFRVAWLDDKGHQRVNRGFRVQFSSALGPYKGGLRLHPSVNLSIIKFLGFEQVFKNALTTLPMGGGKGGSDFDPKGKSDAEIMRFCQSFMTTLCAHIGPNTDVPAGDIGVGGREIGYMFGQYKRIQNEFTGVLTGKNPKWGGSKIRPEATGYGTVYFAREMLKVQSKTLKGMRCLVSGSGNVAQYTIEKLLDEGAIPLTASDSSGYVVEKDGFTREKLALLMKVKNEERGRISDYAKQSGGVFVPNARPWGADVGKVDCAFPSATQNEVELADANALVKAGCQLVAEGANMPSTAEAVDVLKKAKVAYGPAKAANAGGVAVSGLEMSQNSLRLGWTREEVDEKLNNIMKEIFKQCKEAADEYGVPGDYQFGANIAGFLKVADSVVEQGCV
eukprot:Platyproteum_vivax@DN6949_c0_g1_i12.p1